jgi:hypothetical protein
MNAEKFQTLRVARIIRWMRAYAGAVVLVGGVGVVVAGDDHERRPGAVVVAGDAGAASPPLLLHGLEEVDLGADVSLEVARVEHAGAAHGEVHAAREFVA